MGRAVRRGTGPWLRGLRQQRPQGDGLRSLMRSDMEALRSPATIMKLAQEQGALCEIERLTFFKSLETFDHPRNMQIIAEGVETAAELRKVIELGADALQGYFLAKPAAVPAKMAPAAHKVIAEYSSASESG